MASEAQRRAVKRYEAKGDRPGKLITLRLDAALLSKLERAQRPGESFSACIKRLARLGLAETS